MTMKIQRGFVGQGLAEYKESILEAIQEEGVEVIEHFDSYEEVRYEITTNNNSRLTIIDPIYVTEGTMLGSGKEYLKFILDECTDNIIHIPRESICFMESKVIRTICPCSILEELNR